MSKYSRAEIESAFGIFSSALSNGVKSANWQAFADLFTVTVDYCDNGQPQWNTPAEILAGITDFYSEYPANYIADLVPGNSMINEDWSRVTFELYVLMKDPGDGSSRSLPITCVIHYAGNNKWCGEEDYYNLATYGAFLNEWEEIHRRHGGQQ